MFGYQPIKVDGSGKVDGSVPMAESLERIQRLFPNYRNKDEMYTNLKELMKVANSVQGSQTLANNFSFLNVTAPFVSSHPQFRLLAAIFYNKMQLPLTNTKYSMDSSKNLNDEEDAVTAHMQTNGRIQDFVSNAFSQGSEVGSSKFTPFFQMTPLDVYFSGMTETQRDAEILNAKEIKIEEVLVRLASQLFVHQDFTDISTLEPSICRKDLKFQNYQEKINKQTGFEKAKDFYQQMMRVKFDLLKTYDELKTKQKTNPTVTPEETHLLGCLSNLLKGGANFSKETQFGLIAKDSVEINFERNATSGITKDTLKKGDIVFVKMLVDPSKPTTISIPKDNTLVHVNVVTTKPFAWTSTPEKSKDDYPEKNKFYNSDGKSFDEVLKMLWGEVVQEFEKAVIAVLKDVKTSTMTDVNAIVKTNEDIEARRGAENEAKFIQAMQTEIDKSATKIVKIGDRNAIGNGIGAEIAVTDKQLRQYKRKDEFKRLKDSFEFKQEDILDVFPKIQPLNDPDLDRLKQQRKYLLLSLTPGLFYAFGCYLKFALDQYKYMFTNVWSQLNCNATKVLRFKAVGGSLAEPGELRDTVESVIPKILQVSSYENLRILKIRFKEILADHSEASLLDPLSVFFDKVLEHNEVEVEGKKKELSQSLIADIRLKISREVEEEQKQGLKPTLAEVQERFTKAVQEAQKQNSFQSVEDMNSTYRQLTSKKHYYEIEVEIGARDGSNDLSSVERDVSAFLSQLKSTPTTAFDNGSWLYVRSMDLKNVVQNGLDALMASYNSTVKSSSASSSFSSLTKNANERLARKGKRTSARKSSAAAAAMAAREDESSMQDVNSEAFDTPRLFQFLNNMNVETVFFTFSGMENPLYDSETSILHQNFCSLNNHRSSNDSGVSFLDGIQFMQSLQEMTVLDSAKSEIFLRKNRQLKQLTMDYQNASEQIETAQKIIYQSSSSSSSVTTQQKLALFERLQQLLTYRAQTYEAMQKLSGELEESSSIHVASVEDQNRELTRAMKDLQLEQRVKEKKKREEEELKKFKQSNKNLGVSTSVPSQPNMSIQQQRQVPVPNMPQPNNLSLARRTGSQRL